MPEPGLRRWLVIGVAGVAGLIVLAVLALALFVNSTDPPEPGAFYVAPSPLPGWPARDDRPHRGGRGSAPDVADWVADRFGGTAAPNGCPEPAS
jgi:hypothetical protein